MDPSERIGTTLRGKWRLDRVLGTGGFATVYAATHRAGKRVAIKVLHPALNASAEVRRRFLKEAYAANAVDHPGVVGVSDDDVTEDGAAFLVMDLLDGETVEARRKGSGGRLEASTVLDIADQTLAALAAAHAKGVVHRDLKPENLFVTTEDRVKILDFGIARFREPGEEGTATQTGLTMGSPAFMAPEQARGRWAEVDARTDVYSLGATMFMLLSGQLVHGKGNMNETLIAAATRPAPPLATVAPHVPPPVAAIVDRAVAFETEARWPDAQSMRAAVLAAREAVGSAVSTLPLAYAPPLTAGAKPLTATPTLATLPIAEGRPSTPSSTGPVTTSSPVVSAPVTEPTAVLVAPPVPAPPPAGGPGRRRSPSASWVSRPAPWSPPRSGGSAAPPSRRAERSPSPSRYRRRPAPPPLRSPSGAYQLWTCRR